MDEEGEVTDPVIYADEDEDADDLNDELNLSNSLIDGNVEDSTKRQYMAKLLNFKVWLQVKHPQLVMNNKICYEDIEVNVLKEFFDLCFHPSLPRSLLSCEFIRAVCMNFITRGWGLIF